MLVGIVLAAGSSTRMGRVKALLPVDASGETFLARVVRTLREGGVEDVVVVTGFHREPVEQALERWETSVRVVYNPAHDQGQLSSLQAAIRIIDRPGVEGIVVNPVDVPLVKAETVAHLISAYRRTRAALVRPADARGNHGHPVIFDRRLFGELLTADVATGAKPIVRGQMAGGSGIEVPIDDEGAFQDVDTPDAYQRLIGRITPDDNRAS